MDKLARYCYNHPRQILIGWLVGLAALGVGAVVFYRAPSSAISIPGTPAQVAIDQLSKTFPDAGKGTGRIVFHTQGTATIQAYSAAITTGLNKIAKLPGITAVVSPFTYTAEISPDSHTAYAQVQLSHQNGQIPISTLDSVSSNVHSMVQPGLEVEYGGDLINNVPEKILGPTEVLGVGLALVVLLVMFGSVVAAGIPLLNALIGVGAGMAGLFALSRVVSINSTTPALSVMLGLAVGIDYSLFIISKYRNLRLAGVPATDATAQALVTAGRAVTYAAGTVIIALAALSVVRIPFMTVMGLSASATVLFAAAAALTVTPALFRLTGDRMLNPKQRLALTQPAAPAPAGKLSSAVTAFRDRWISLLTVHPWAVLIICVATMAVIALPVIHLQLGFPSDQFAAADKTQRKAYDLMTKAFGPGFNTPLSILVEHVPPVTDADRAQVSAGLMAAYQAQVQAAAAQQQAAFAAAKAQAKTRAQQQALQKQVAAAQAAGAAQQQQALAQINQYVAQAAPLYELNLIAKQIAPQPDVQSATPAIISKDGAIGLIQITPKSAPASKDTLKLIQYLRDHQQKFLTNHAVNLQVTGATALQIDTNSKLAAALPEYLLVIVGLSLVLLTLAFRSIVIPLKATGGFVLSVLAMFGAIVMTFQWGLLNFAAPAPIISFVPIIGIGVLFGLAMDYEFFVVSSMREAYTANPDPQLAVTDGFKLGSKVVAAAGSIMVAVFSGFVGNGNVVIQTLGFGLAAGILMDAFIVRMTIVPSAMSLLGRRAWWFPLKSRPTNAPVPSAPAPAPAPAPQPQLANPPSPAVPDGTSAPQLPANN